MGRFVWSVLLAGLLNFVLLAQDSQVPQLKPAESAKTAPPAIVGGNEREVLLDVQVTDKSGAPVRGLQQQDFTLLDDKLPLNIVSFRAVDPAATAEPVEIVLVIDAVNASFQNVTYEREQLKKFLLQNGGKLEQPVSLVLFEDTGTKLQPSASRDGNALAALYDQYETGLRSIKRSSGFYGAAERFSLSIKTIGQLTAYEAKKPGRKFMVWFSPGWPMLSGPGIELSNKDMERMFSSVVALSTQLRQARVTLYQIDPLGVAEAGGMRVTYYEQFLKGVPSISKVTAGNLALQVLAVQSGGRVFNSSNDLTNALANCASDATGFYDISFNAPRADRANEYHSLEVTVNKPGVVARTRTGYYAQP